MSKNLSILLIFVTISIVVLTYSGRGDRYLNILAQVVFIILLIFSVYYALIDARRSTKRYQRSARDYYRKLTESTSIISKKVRRFKIFDSRLKAVLLLMGISALIYHNWLSFSVFISGDYHWITATSLSYLKPLSAWRAFISTGEPNWVLWSGYSTSLFGFFGNLGLDSNVVMNVLVLWFLVLIAPIISFFFVKQFTHKVLTAFIFALLLLFNAYVLTNTVVGHLLLSVAFYFSLAAMTFYYIFIKSKLTNTPALVLSAILLWVTGTIDFRIFYISMFSFFTFQVLYLLFNKIKVPIRRFFSKNALLLLLLILLNMYWLLPTTVIKGTNDILTRTLFAKGLIDLFNSWSGTYYYWSLSNKIIWGVDTGFPAVFMLQPLLVILVLYFVKKKSITMIFTVLYIIGAFFGKQNTAPFSRLYEFLFEYFPGFSAFRDATKMFQITTMSLPIILATGYEAIANKFVQKAIIAGVALIVVLNVYSLIRFQNHLLIPATIPDYYQDLAKLESERYHRLLWVPRNETIRTGTANSPRMALIDVRYGSWSPVLDTKYDSPSKTSEILQNSNLRSLLAMSTIKYLFVPKQLQTEDMQINDDAFYYDDNREEIISILRSFPWLVEREIQSKDASLFEMDVFRPHVYLTNERENLRNMHDLDVTEVANDFINSSTYKLYLKNISKTTYLTFTDSFSEQWLLGPAYSSNFSFALSKDPPSPINFRTKNQAGGNVFTVDREYIQSIASDFELNTDGSVNAEVTLYYSPQKKLILGNYITISTFVVICMYFVQVAVKNYGHRNTK